jgi:hypothetical protein
MMLSMVKMKGNGAEHLYKGPSTMLVKGPSKHIGVSRIGTNLIPDEFIEFNGCKWRGHIIDP